MRLLDTKLEFCDFDDKPPPYAIISHTWSERNEEEVSYHDLKEGTTKSLRKLELCRDWTIAAKLEYFWIDTCCIDKQIQTEINDAIRSMWQWYHKAEVCFVYLSDLSPKRKPDSDAGWRDELKKCRWFTRGWTLQELVAPKRVEFYSQDGGCVGTKEELLPTLRIITGIDLNKLRPTHAARLSWVTKRETKRPEDKAYCMIGICEVSILPDYGEGAVQAWRRLEDAIRHRFGTVALEVRDAVASSDHRSTILEALRFKTLETRRNTVEAAEARTCKWILDHPACAKWLKQEHKFFWIKGKPGAGKSVLIKYLDQNVTKKLKKTNAIGLYFYFNARGEQLERSFLGLYRSLLVQLVDAVPELAHELDALDLQLDLLQLQRVLASAIAGLGKQIWLFVDALDECREGDVRDLIEFLQNLEDAQLSVCLASRHYPVVKVPTNLQLVLEEVDAHEQDLRTYVERLNLPSDELAQIQDEIVAKANGIFLWVVLVVRLLEKDVDRGRFHAIQSRLRQIPEGLPDLFKTIIFRDNEHKDEFVLCIRWILYAWRPLSLNEWYFAMLAGIDGRIERTANDIDHRMETFLLSSSKGLAELTKGKTVTVQFIHESVRDYLVLDGGLEDICGEDEALESTAHGQLKRCCLRGIDFDLPRQLVQRANKKQLLSTNERHSLIVRYPFAEYATTYLLHHADQAVSGTSQSHSLTSDFEISAWLPRFNILQTKKPAVYHTVPPLSYLCAERNLPRLIKQPADLMSYSPAQRYKSPLLAAIFNSSWEVLRTFLIHTNAHNVDEIIAETVFKTKFALEPRLQEIPWCWTIKNGLEHLSRHLLRSVSEQEFSAATQLTRSPAMALAIEGGNKALFEHLLASSQSGVNAEHDMGVKAGGPRLPLVYACEVGSGDIVEHCLLLGADVNGQGGRYGNALQAAAFGESDKAVSILLAAGADVNAQGGEYGNALQAAAYQGFDQAVALLLAAGADVNARGGRWGSALEAARRLGNEGIVQILLNHGACDEVRGR